MKMKDKLVFRCIRICFRTCLKDSILLLCITALLGMLPVAVLFIYNTMILVISIRNENIYSIGLLLFLYCFALFLQKSIYNFYHHYYLNYHSLLNFEKKIRKYFYERCNHLNLQDYLYPEMVNGTRRAQFASINIFRVYQIVVEIAVAVIGIVCIGGVIVTIDKRLLIFLLLSIAPPVLDKIYQIVQRKYLLYRNSQPQKEVEEYLKFLTRTEHIKEIRVMECFSFVFHKWQKVKEDILCSEKRVLNKELLVSLVFQILKLSGTIGAYVSTTHLFMNGQITLSQFTVSIYTFSQITALFHNLFSLLGNLTEFSIMVEPFFHFVDSAYSQIEIQKEDEKDIVLSLRDVSYAYPDTNKLALKNINLTIKRGTFVSIVGSNGSGKTTLSKIMLGLLTPSGTITADIREDMDYLKNKSYIPQQFHCYYISIKDNVLMGNNINDKKLRDGFINIGLEELLSLENNMYGLEFGGMELSGGQKQRLAILRAILKDADVLILDEPTSAIDPLQESAIYHMLLKVFKGKTAIMVSHRLSLTKKSDVIVVLNNGEIREMGTHSQLMTLQGEYANMWSTQANVYQ